MSVKINSLQLENVKLIKAVKLEPTENGLTLIGGKNNQGKTSVLDSIAYALGGADFKPSNTKREGSMVDPYLRVTLSNGIIAERKGKSSALKVTDPSGNKAGQTLLDSFISAFALDLPKFMNSTDKEKAKVLLQIIGVGDKLAELDLEEDRLANERLTIGRIKKEKQGHAEQMVQWDGVPEEPISATDLIRQQQEILAKNGENQQKREKAKQIKLSYDRALAEVQDLEIRLDNAKKVLETLANDLATANKTAENLQDESTEALQRNLEEIESINAKVRDNLEKAKAQMEADEYVKKYSELNEQIEKVRNRRMSLLDGVQMPLDGLSVDHGTLIYNGQPWDNMSGSDQLKVATAIVRKLKPECGFVLMDKLEQMDLDTLKDFGSWLEAEGLQAIATRVSTGDECTVYIEDGYSVDHNGNKTADEDLKPAEMMKPAEAQTKWEAGKF
jgi:predicted ATP-dependent endonuclease of OLD family